MEIGDRLKIIRKEANLNQAEFGEKIGVSESAVSNYESGRRPLSDPIIKLVCKTFGYYHDWLVNGTEPKKISVKAKKETLQALKEEFSLDDVDVKIMEIYLTLSPDERSAIRKFIKIIRDAD